jgi:hypothetical protein
MISSTLQICILICLMITIRFYFIGCEGEINWKLLQYCVGLRFSDCKKYVPGGSDSYQTIWRLQPPPHAGSSLAEFSTLKMKAMHSSETSVHTRTTRHHIKENGILHSNRRENLKSYICGVTFTTQKMQCCSIFGHV